MKTMNVFTKKITVLVLAACVLAVSLSACAGSSSSSGSSLSEGEYYVYYTNSEADSILYKTHVLSDEAQGDVLGAAEELLAEMFSGEYTEQGYYSANLDEVGILYSRIEDRVLYVEFSTDYLLLSLVKEIILRSALVLTVIQIDGIDAVVINVDGESITDSEGNPVGQMTAEDFVDVLLNEESMLTQSEQVTIMFANEAGDGLVPVEYEFEISSNMSMEEYILAQLMAGPEEGSGAFATISAEVVLISVSTNNHVCYVNFDSTFLEQEQPVSDTLLIYSIVNSLCRLSNVSSVQFLIDSEPATTLHQVTDISGTFTRDRTLEVSE